MKYEITELKTLVTNLLDDLDAQVQKNAEVNAGLEAAWQEAVDKSRTADEFDAWLEDYLTQVAVAWVLTCVFVRFLEDNQLVRGVWIAGEGRAGDEARDRTDEYFQKHPTDSETDYLLHVFRHFAQLPAGELFGEKRNPLYRVPLSGGAGRSLLQFWRERDPDTGELKRKGAPAASPADGSDTRFLGDLYQDLSDHAKKKYALLQTPDFVEEYILDYTLDPAIDTFGLDTVRFIDPTCGSGHFLLGGFQRIFERKLAARPGAPRIDLVREALDATHGVDLNPFAVAIARFRLLIAAMTALGDREERRRAITLDDAPELPIHVGVGDTLIHGKRFLRFETSVTKNVAQLELDRFKLTDQERWVTEDNDLIDYILGQQYHAVVGNPPYITPKDKASRDAYRDLYESCYRQYALVCPFYERFFELAGGERLGEDMFSGERWSHDYAGYVGMIVANSFMKREFGSKLIEAVIPQTDLTHVIDTSGAYIPGHGTPTVILFGRNQKPASDHVRAVLGIRGEPKTPPDPRLGKVWRSIADHTDEVDFENDFVTVSDLPGSVTRVHPWTLRGGGALDGKLTVESQLPRLGEWTDDIGRTTVFGEDDAWLHDRASARRADVHALCVDVVIGQEVRDYAITGGPVAPYPYEGMGGRVLSEVPNQYFWPLRTILATRSVFGKSLAERGEPYYAHLEHYDHRLRTPLSITFAFVATHNHFVLDRGGKVFKQSAPVIKLPADATEDDHLGLLGLLNSSTACFWLKQVCMGKHMGDGGSAHADPAYQRFEFDSTKLQQLPITEQRPLDLARRLDEYARRLGALQPSELLASGKDPERSLSEMLDHARDASEKILRKMVALQEELDWRCYELYGLLDEGTAPLTDHRDDVPEVALGERAFEIVMARKIEAGDLVTTWFDRHGSTPVTEIPTRWPEWYRELVARRIDLIAEKRFVRLIEQPEYKRRWNRDSWDDLEKDALQSWMLDRLESPAYVAAEPASGRRSLRRVAELADIARDDADFVTAAERYTGNPNVVIDALIAELLKTECVPFLPSQRYKKGGIKKRKKWEQVWDLQRREDAGEKVKIPKPPKYTQADFQSSTVYKLRGKLDVPKERFTVYPGLEVDGHTMVTWAGLDHKQRAQALASFYFEARDQHGFDTDQLTLVLAGLADLVPWVKQWHNELDPEFGIRFGDYLETFVAQHAAELGVGFDAVENARL